MALNLRRESVRSKVRVLDQGEMVADVTFRALDLGRKVGRSEVQGLITGKKKVVYVRFRDFDLGREGDSCEFQGCKVGESRWQVQGSGP